MSEERISKEEFIKAFNNFFRPLCYYADSFVNDKDDAYDIVLNAFLKAWEIGTFDNQHKLKGFLYIKVGNDCRNYIRHLKVLRDTEDELGSILERQLEEKEITAKMAMAEFMTLVYKYMEEMPPMKKKVFELSYLQNATNSEIADKLKITIHTVKEHKGRALNFLRHMFGSDFHFKTVAIKKLNKCLQLKKNTGMEGK